MVFVSFNCKLWLIFTFISALTVRYLTGKFIYDYATGEDFIYPYHTNLNNGQVQINIVDTSRNVSTILNRIKHGIFSGSESTGSESMRGDNVLPYSYLWIEASWKFQI